MADLCRSCQHPLESHIRSINDLSDDQIDRILLVVYDMDNILLQMRNEREDQDLRRTYGYLFQFLKKNMLQPRLPSLAGDKLGTPPFEKVSIAKVHVQSHCRNVAAAAQLMQWPSCTGCTFKTPNLTVV